MVLDQAVSGVLKKVDILRRGGALTKLGFQKSPAPSRIAGRGSDPSRRPRRHRTPEPGASAAPRTGAPPALQTDGLMDDLEPITRQFVRVSIDGIFRPEFRFLPGGQLQPTVTALLCRATELPLSSGHKRRVFADRVPRPGKGQESSGLVGKLPVHAVLVIMPAIELHMLHAILVKKGRPPGPID